MLAGQKRESVNATETDRETAAAEHFSAFLIAFVQQATLRCFGLALCRVGLFSHAPR